MGGVQGSILYAYYGMENDFMLLRDRNINLSGKVMLVRAGKISFAEKVGAFSKIQLFVQMRLLVGDKL